ncbi:MAG TPA: DUF4149 domain-containing protein [Acidobacteriaceae bacterium]
MRQLTMVVWVGGLIFFAFVEAPTAFRVMGTTRQFAQIIGDSISELNRLGQICGFIFLIATAMVWLRAWRRRRWLLMAQIVLTVLMIGATMVVQAGILPAMERDRIAAGGDITAAPATNPARVDFERLHPLSEKVEGTALFLGLFVVILMAYETRSPNDSRPSYSY